MSCPCNSCTELFSDKEVNLNFGKKSNLGIPDCNKRTYFDCTNKVYYKTDKEPLINPNYYYGFDRVNLNDRIGLDSSPEFIEISCKKEADNCNREKVYTTPYDGRLIDPRRNITIVLDRPPLEGQVNMNDVYQDKLLNYGKNYSSYSDIHSGQILYYIDKTISDPYYNPNFVIRSEVEHVLFQDPMGAIKPQYYRRPFTNTFNNLSNDQQTRDTLFFREDIMARQQAKYNQQRFDARYNDEIPSTSR
jgi:hypothetical protein